MPGPSPLARPGAWARHTNTCIYIYINIYQYIYIYIYRFGHQSCLEHSSRKKISRGSA